MGISSGEKTEKDEKKEKREKKEEEEEENKKLPIKDEKNKKEKVPLYQYLEIEHEKKMKVQQQKLLAAPPYKNNMNLENKAPYLFPPQNGTKTNYINNGYQQYANNMNNNYNMNYLMMQQFNHLNNKMNNNQSFGKNN